MQEPENFTQGLTRMLELAGKSQAYLNRAFYKYYGQTPTAFINSCRMTEACRLLRSTEEKILDIAYICGYENLSYFNRQFRARYGQTPKEYRSQKRFFE
jgi:AraC-like DNA-binding protein